MNRWYAETNPQHMLPGSAARAIGTTFRVSQRDSKPARPGRRP